MLQVADDGARLRRNGRPGARCCVGTGIPSWIILPRILPFKKGCTCGCCWGTGPKRDYGVAPFPSVAKR